MPADSLAGFQSDFLRRIMAATNDGADGMAIHRSTYFHGLLDGLGEIYEATRMALGEEAFGAFARDFLRANPLRSGDRNGYGAAFGDSLEVHPHLPAAWLPDLARFEWALHEAHHARDAEPAGFAALLAPESRVGLHPSARLLALSHDVKRLHTTLIEGAEPAPVRAVNCDMLVSRDRDDTVMTLCLAPCEVAFIDLIVRHGSLTGALERLEPGDDDMRILQDLLARLVAGGLLITL